jgi:hypothetical protein
MPVMLGLVAVAAFGGAAIALSVVQRTPAAASVPPPPPGASSPAPTAGPALDAVADAERDTCGEHRRASPSSPGRSSPAEAPRRARVPLRSRRPRLTTKPPSDGAQSLAEKNTRGVCGLRQAPPLNLPAGLFRSPLERAHRPVSASEPRASASGWAVRRASSSRVAPSRRGEHAGRRRRGAGSTFVPLRAAESARWVQAMTPSRLLTRAVLMA